MLLKSIGLPRKSTFGGRVPTNREAPHGGSVVGFGGGGGMITQERFIRPCPPQGVPGIALFFRDIGESLGFGPDSFW